MTSLSLTSRVRVNDKILFQEIDDEAVLLNLDSGVYFGLDEVGKTIWKLLLTHEQLSLISEAIDLEFEVEAERRNADLIEFVGKLLANDLVRIAS